MDILITLIKVLLLFVCVLMVLVVLMQRPKQEGLGAAFGGGITDSLLGAGTTGFLQKATVYMAVFFFVASTALAVLVAKRQRGDNAIALGLESEPLPASVTSPEGSGSLDGLDLSVPPLELPGDPGGAGEPPVSSPLEGGQPGSADPSGPEPATGEDPTATGAVTGSEPGSVTAPPPATDPVPVPVPDPAPEPAPPAPGDEGAGEPAPGQGTAGGEEPQ